MEEREQKKERETKREKERNEGERKRNKVKHLQVRRKTKTCHPLIFIIILSHSLSSPSLLPILSLFLPSYSDCSIFTHFNHSKCCLLIVVFWLHFLLMSYLSIQLLDNQTSLSIWVSWFLIFDTCRMCQPLIRSQVTFPEGVSLISSRDLCDFVFPTRAPQGWKFPPWNAMPNVHPLFVSPYHWTLTGDRGILLPTTITEADQKVLRKKINLSNAVTFKTL